VGQPSDPYQNEDEDNLGITISGLPGEPEEPEDVESSGPEEPEGDFDAEAVELAAGDMVLVEGTGLDTEVLDEDGDPVDDDDVDVAGLAGASDDTDDDGIDADAATDDAEDDDAETDAEAEDDDVGDEVAYDLAEWEDDQLSLLFDKLSDAGIDYLWDGEELYVREADEPATDVVIEAVSYPDQLDEEADDGDAGAELLGNLYIAADRLKDNPEEHESVASLLKLADTVEEASAPYGMADAEWKNICEKVESLAQQLEAEKLDIEESAEAARTLRNAIRGYV
jgi:hypothetical protein